MSESFYIVSNSESLAIYFIDAVYYLYTACLFSNLYIEL